MLNIQLLDADYSICKLGATDAIPAWVAASNFYTITKSSDELSIVCQSKFVPTLVLQDGGWRLIKIAAVLDLSLTGITARFSTALANAGVNLCVIATFNTDYIMVKADKLPKAIDALATADFTLI